MLRQFIPASIRLLSLPMVIVFLLIAPAHAQQPSQLTINQPIEKNLSGDDSHIYRFSAEAEQFFRLNIQPAGIDVAVKLMAPNGKELVEIDMNGIGAMESAVWLAETSGEYLAQVSGADKNSRGKYKIELTELRLPTEQDRSRLAAQTEYLAASKMAEERSADAKREAAVKYEKAAKLWNDAGERGLSAAALFGAGDTKMRLGAYPQSIELFNQALSLRRTTGDRSEQSDLLVAIGQSYFFQNQKDKAIDPFTQALEIRRSLGDREGEGAVLNNLGATYSDLGDTRKAREVLEQALPLRHEPRQKVATLANLGRAYRAIGEKRKAIRTLEEALKLRRSLRDRVGEADTLANIALNYADLGEQQKALDLFTQALSVQRTAGVLNFTGRSYYMLGAQEAALQHFEQALAAARNAKNRNIEADVLNSMALAHWSLEDYPKAIATLNQALPIAIEIKARATESAILNNYGRVYSSQGDQRKAIEYYEKALPLIRQSGNPNNEAALLNNLGFAYEALGESAKALNFHQQALRISSDVRDGRREAKVRYGIARIESSRNRLKQAREQMEKTIKLAESQRSKLNSPDLRAEFRASAQQYYDLYIDVLMRMGKRVPGKIRNQLIGEALQVSEQARARSLVELLTEAGANIRQGVDAALIERERDLQDQINDKTTEQINLMRDGKKADQSATVAKELEQLTVELGEVQIQIRSNSPRYASLIQPQPLTANEIQKQILNPWSLLLEYSLGEERSYLWVVSQNSIRSFTLPKRSVIEAAAKRFYDLATARNQFVPGETVRQKQARIASADAESQQAAAALSKLIIAPAASLLGNKRLVIVADGALQYIPFAALPLNPQSATRNTRLSRPLISLHEIVTLPSATTLAALRNETAERKPAAKTVAVIADPVFEAKDDRIKIVSIKADGKSEDKSGKKVEKPSSPVENDPSRILVIKSAKDSGAGGGDFPIPRLPNTRREAETILSLVSDEAGKSAFDFAATRETATGDDLGQYRILHYATHGFLNGFNPELSGLVLSLVDEQGKPQNGYLLAPEIYNLKLPATDLVVLSACQTGLGKEVKGEGIIGLTRGFMYAGSPRVVVSLWNVNDRATADLMKHFYEAMLSKDQRPAEALRSAQLQLLRSKQWQSPYFWAAFGLQGEWR